jgi:integral membrane sensor domain MASE1
MESDAQGSAPTHGQTAGEPRTSAPPGSEPADALHIRFQELAEGIRVYVQSQLDLLKLAVRRGIIFAGIFIVAILGAASVFVTAVVLLCMGISDAISELIGHRWAGEIATGVLVVGGGGLAAFVYLWAMERRSKRQIVQKYEAMNRRENGNGKHHE